MGVLGASRIVSSALGAVSSGLVDLNALAAREQGRAEVFSQSLGIPRSYGSYGALLDDPDLDAVYVALPAAHHAEWCERALLSNKHVLCEKPFALSLAEAEKVVRLAESRGLLLMEAHHWRYHPLVETAASRIRSLGALTSVEASFKVGLNNPGDIRLDPLLGPGVVMDFGCYAIQWCDFVVEMSRGAVPELPQVISASLIEGEPGVDLACEVQLDYDGLRASFSCDMRDGLPFSAYVRAEANPGDFRFENPLGVLGSEISGTAGRVDPAPEAASTYRRQLQAFVDALTIGVAPPTSGDNILRTQATIDAIYKKSGIISRSDLRTQALRTQVLP